MTASTAQIVYSSDKLHIGLILEAYNDSLFVFKSYLKNGDL